MKNTDGEKLDISTASLAQDRKSILSFRVFFISWRTKQIVFDYVVKIITRAAINCAAKITLIRSVCGKKTGEVNVSFFALLFGLLLIKSSTAGEISRCPMNDIPIQIINKTTSGPVTFLSEADVSDSSPSISPHFRYFVTSITERIKTHLGNDNICIDTSRSLIKFVKWPLTIRLNDEIISPTLPQNIHTASSCRIISPWIELFIERGQFPSAQGIVRWNQRQLLTDQANLDSGRDVVVGLASPLSSKELAIFAEDFERSMTLGEKSGIEDRIPPDIFWLFKHTAKSGFESYYMNVRGSVVSAQIINADDYTKLVLALIDRCINSGKEKIEYKSIVDAYELIDVEQYKIEYIINGHNRRKIKK